MTNKSIYLKLFVLVSFTLVVTLTVTPVQSQSPCQEGQEANGLISVGTDNEAIVGTFGTNIDGRSPCVLDPSADVNPKVNRIPVDSYESLKTLYFSNSKLPSSGDQQKYSLTGNQTTIDLSFRDKIFHISGGNLTLTGSTPISGTYTGVIFIDGYLQIGPLTSNQLVYGTNNTGLVFVVKGDVYIDKSVRRVDAVIISEGVICTASDTNLCPATPELIDPGSTTQLTIYGSLVALNPTKQIRFKRNLTNNQTTAAEQIVAQPKYLAILRNMFASTWQKWTEVP